jgi:glycerol-3-phosphate acyltransferase PlsY
MSPLSSLMTLLVGGLWHWLAIALAGGYLLGSIPFGLILTRAAGFGDVRSIGSGNIGATNVLRTGNKGAAAATLLLDAGKGAVAVLVARAIAGEQAAMVAGFAAFLGHLFPVWLGFRGGKGVATFLGTMLALAWPVGIAACLTWLATAIVFRYSSLAALVAAAATPLWLLLLGRADAVWLGVALAILVFIRHHANIRRLLDGTEPKIGKDK